MEVIVRFLFKKNFAQQGVFVDTAAQRGSCGTYACVATDMICLWRSSASENYHRINENIIKFSTNVCAVYALGLVCNVALASTPDLVGDV